MSQQEEDGTPSSMKVEFLTVHIAIRTTHSGDDQVAVTDSCNEHFRALEQSGVILDWEYDSDYAGCTTVTVEAPYREGSAFNEAALEEKDNEVLMSNNLSEVQVLCDEDDLGTATRIPHPSLHNCYDIGPADNGFRISPFIRDELLAQNEELYTRSLGFYHPSALASNNCDRALAYERLAVVPRPIFNEWDFRYFALGHAIHGIIQTLVKKRLGDAVEVEPRISVPALHIDGAADIIYRNKFVTDIKTVSAAELEKLEVARKKDALQMQPYFIARDIPNGSILYVSRENMKRKEIPVQFNRKMVTKITERIGSIETTLAAGGLPAREGNAGDCASCKYQFICKPADSSY